MNIKVASRIISTLFFYVLLSCIQYVKIKLPSGILMPWNPFFLMAPLAGGFFGPCVAAYLLIGKRIKSCLRGSLFSLTYHIPTFFASAYWAHTGKTIRLIVPLVCMAAFILHPVGSQAWVYSLYWLIPVVLYFIKYESLPLTALGSTFIQHAVGSIFWLYLVPMTSQQWIALIPVVFFERLCAFVLLLIGSYCALYLEQYSMRFLSRIVYKKRTV